MDYLEYLYSGQGYVSRIYEVCKAFYHPEKKAKTLTTYFMEFKKIYEELNMLFPFSTDIKVQQAQREQMAVMSFLAGLPSEFETAKSQILSDSEITSLKDVFSWVLRTESTSSNQQTNVLNANGEEKNDARRNYCLQAMSESFFAGTETNAQSVAKVPHTKSTYSDSQNHVTGQRNVAPTCVPLANAQLEDRNIDILCSSPTVISSTSRSSYNNENNVESRSTEVSYKGTDHERDGLRTSIFDWAEDYQLGVHGQEVLRTSKFDWVEEYQLDVFITLTVLPSGGKRVERVKFSKKKFSEKEAKKWWEENWLSVYRKYDVEGYESVNQSLLKK